MQVTLYILKFRQQKGLSQHYMAHQLGTTVKTYARLERGEGKLTLEMLGKIACILEVNPYLLFKIRIPMDQHPAKINGKNPETSKQYDAVVSRLENQLKNSMAENSKLRRILMNRWEMFV